MILLSSCLVLFAARGVLSAPLDPSIDTNSDGQLDADEIKYAAFVHHGLSGSVVDTLFKEVDKNMDGLLDPQEFDTIKVLVMDKAENAALRYLQNVDTDRDGLLSLKEAQAYILRENGIGWRDVERIWKLVTPDVNANLNATMFSRLRRRIRGMTIRIARQVMKASDTNGDGHISIDEAQAIAFEQEGIAAGDVVSMFHSVDENNDGELNAPEFADFERIVRARSLDNAKKAMRIVDADGSGTLTLEEAKQVAFEHYGFDEATLAPFFGQADENEDGQLDIVEFAGFRTVIRARSVRDSVERMKSKDSDRDGLISALEAMEMTKHDDDMDPAETTTLFNIADQNKSGKLDKVEFADFNRLVRLSSIKFATDHFKEFDLDGDNKVTFQEIAILIEHKYQISHEIVAKLFEKIDVDHSGDLIPAEIVDFRHLIRDHVSSKLAEQKKEPLAEAEPVDDVISQSTDAVSEDAVIAQHVFSTRLQRVETTTVPTTTTTVSTTTTTVPSTTTIPTTTTILEEVVVEEIVYEDGTPARRNSTANNSDVSYEEIIEYVDEPAPKQ